MIYISIPAYNEAENIGMLLERLIALGYSPQDYRVVIINDGSRDDTVAIVDAFKDRMPVSVVSHPTNLGVGQGFRTAFNTVLAQAKPSDILVTMEADNTSDLGLFNKMVQLVQQDKDIVLASCYAKGGGIEGSNGLRIFLSESANLLLRIFYPIGVRTYSSFYRAYRVDVLQHAMAIYGQDFITEPGFVCMVEVLIKLHRMKANIVEVPMILKTNMRKGASKMRVFRTIMSYLHFIAKDWPARFQSVPPVSQVASSEDHRN
jgi:dolichol-phosphate mannosyltransferase